jgi:hypothetical protein
MKTARHAHRPAHRRTVSDGLRVRAAGALIGRPAGAGMPSVALAPAPAQQL